MPTNTVNQIESIREMMASGHHSVRIEPHTLVLWGTTAALLILLTAHIFTRELFPVPLVRILSSTGFITAVVTLVGIIDFRKTRNLRRERDETLSFVQLQLTKVWWLLIALIVLLDLGMHLFGGGYLFFGVALVIIGLAFYINGLFSKQMLTWIGLCLMIMGVGSIVLNLPFPLMKLLAAITLGVGFPLMAVTSYRPQLTATFTRRALFTLFWLLAVILPTAGIYTIQVQSTIPVGSPLSLDEYNAKGATASGETIVHLPAGTKIPVHIALGGNVVQHADSMTIPIQLSKPIDVVVTNGELDGRYRVAEAAWQLRHYDFRFGIDKMHATLRPGKEPQVDLHIRVHSKKTH